MRIGELKMVQPQGLLQQAGRSDKETGKGFGEFLTDALQEVNQLQHTADKASLDLAAGKLEDVSQVVIAAEKANIAVQLTMQVRNKAVEAYQEIMRTSV